MVKVFEFKDKLGEEYHDVLDFVNIEGEGKNLVSDRNQEFVDAEPILIEVYNPVVGMPSEVLPQYIIQRWGENFIFEYANNVAFCVAEKGDFDYSYGERLSRNNQVVNVIEKIKQNPDTRQGTCVLYAPSDTDRNVIENPPCLSVVDFKVRNGKLRVFGWLRSNDMENAYPSNYYDLLMVANRVSDETGYPIGRITSRSESAHIYRWSR